MTYRGYYWGENYDLYRPTPSHVPQTTTTYYSRKLGFTHQNTPLTTQTERGQFWIGRGHWSLTSTTITTNLELTRLLKLGVQSVSSFRRLARCIVGKTGDFLDFLINTSQYHVSISEACRLNKAYLRSCKYGKTKQSHCMSIKQAKLIVTAVRLLTTRTCGRRTGFWTL